MNPELPDNLKTLDENLTTLFAGVAPDKDFESRVSPTNRRAILPPAARTTLLRIAAVVALGAIGYGGMQYLQLQEKQVATLPPTTPATSRPTVVEQPADRAAGLGKQQDQLVAQDLADKAAAAANDGKIALAGELYSHALEKDPSNAAAHTGQAKLLEKSGLAQPVAIEQRFGDALQPRHDALDFSFRRSLESARSALRSKDIAGARVSLDQAEIAAKADATVFSKPELERMQSTIADARAHLATIKAIDQVRSESNASAEDLKRVGESRQANEIASLKDQAQELQRRGNYVDAIKAVDQIHALDPNDAYANGIRQILVDRNDLRQAHGTERGAIALASTLNQVDEKMIPYSEVMTYPTNWPDLSARRDQTVRDERPISRDRDVDGPATQELKQLGRSAIDGKAPPTANQNSANFTAASTLQTGVNGNLGADLTTGARLEGETTIYGWTPSVAGTKEEELEKGIKKRPVDFDDSALTAIRLNVANPTATAPKLPDVGYFDRSTLDRKSVETPTGGTILMGGMLVASATGTTEASPASGKPFDADDTILLPKQTDQAGAPAKPEEGKDTADKNTPATPVPTTPTGAPTVAPTPTAEQQAIAIQRKIIRNGEMEFEVDSFDSSIITVTKLAAEDGGFVSSTDSAKLNNGKMRGTIVVRMPPERLDVFVLKLRGLGDLKSQQIKASDVTKQYTDIESSLRAARAMEERLLKIIKDGTGAVKDLLAAEKELGTWREKIETLEGEKRYYDNLVTLSTLSITLQERDIRAASGAIECERVNSGIETEDVEKSRADALKAIDEAKGRVISADLKKLDAGQFAATIVAEIPPENAGPVIDRLRQLGKVARLDIDRKQTTTDGSSAPLPGAKIEKRPTLLTVNFYNLANIAPRQTNTLTVAVENVESAYREIIDRVNATPGARIVASSLTRPRPDQPAASLRFETKTGEADNALADLKSRGEVMSLSSAENPDTSNSTLAKRGFEVQLVSLAAIPARQTITQQLVVASVSDTHAKLQEIALRMGGKVTVSDLREGRRDQTISTLEVDIPINRSAFATTQDARHPTTQDVRNPTTPAEWWDGALSTTGDTLSRSVVRSSDVQNTIDTKVHYVLTLFALESVPPRQSTIAIVTVASAENAAGQLAALGAQLGGRVRSSNLSKDTSGRSITTLTLDLPYSQNASFLGNLRGMGELASFDTVTNPNIPDGALSQSRFQLTLSEAPALVNKSEGPMTSLREGLATSLRGLGYSLQLIVVGLCLAGPWAVVIWIGYKLFKRRRNKSAV